VVVALGALTALSFREDAADQRFQEAAADAEVRARLARTLAVEHGVPAVGGTAVFDTAPFARAKRVWKQTCVGCHQGGQRSAPLLARGYNSRAWLRAFLRDPSGPTFFGPTEHRGMPPAPIAGAELTAVVEMLYRETGAADADAALAARGQEIFAGAGKCTGCHLLDGDEEGGIGPNLGGRGSLDMLRGFIAMPAHPRWFGEDAEMPDFFDEIDRTTRAELARYLLRMQKTDDWPALQGSDDEP